MKIMKVVGTILAVFVIFAGCLTAGCAGEQGEDGVGIASTVDNGDGTFTLTFTDGTSFTTDDLTGPQGEQGAQGAQGEQGERGLPGGSMAWQGEWAVSTLYAVDDAVENDGSSYICIQAHTSSSSDEPGDSVGWQDYWELFAQAGETGAKGDTGDTGAQGEQGEPGENMVLASGTVSTALGLRTGYNIDTVEWNATFTRWDVTVTEDVDFNTGDYSIVVTPYGTSAYYVTIAWGSPGDRFSVYLYNSSGTKTQGVGFQFIVLDLT